MERFAEVKGYTAGCTFRTGILMICLNYSTYKGWFQQSQEPNLEPLPHLPMQYLQTNDSLHYITRDKEREGMSYNRLHNNVEKFKHAKNKSTLEIYLNVTDKIFLMKCSPLYFIFKGWGLLNNCPAEMETLHFSRVPDTYNTQAWYFAKGTSDTVSF